MDICFFVDMSIVLCGCKLRFAPGHYGSRGKTAICNQIAGRLDTLVALDGDVIWSCGNFTPEKTEAFYAFVLRLCAEIEKSGVAVAVFHAGAGVPGNIESCPEIGLFDDIHYLGLYCNDEELEKRLRARPEWQDQNSDDFINAMKDKKDESANRKKPARKAI